jgi:hypothetical protein
VIDCRPISAPKSTAEGEGIMSDHAWTQEHIAAAVADGLSAQETERLDAHVRDCPDCSAALRDARGLNDRLGSLFAPARPGPMLEDRVIKGLREATVRRRRMSGWRRRLAIGLAASVGIGVAGVAAEKLSRPGPIPAISEMFGELGAIHIAQGRDESVAVADSTDSMANNLASRLNSALAERANSIASSNSTNLGRTSTDSVRFGEENAPAPAPAQAGGDRNSGQSANAGAGGANFHYQFNAPIGVNTQTGPEKNGPANWNDFLSPNSALSISQGIPDWSQNRVKSYEAPAPNIDAPFNTQLGVKLPANQPAGPMDAFYIASGEAVPARSLGYVNPSDMKPTLPAAEPQQGEIRLGEWKGGEKGEQLVRQAPPRQVKAYPAQQVTIPAPADAAPAPEPASPRKIVIRSGEMEFEIESFDAAVATVTKLVIGTSGGYVDTVNSEKLPNGRVKGSIALRVPPDRLDSLVLDLRKELGKGGELKGQRIGSQDITKQYTDLESRLRAARTMEGRLLQMIKDGKGEIKQLLEAEKELGTWRTKIEECEGELRYFGNLVALSTLKIALEEKGIGAAAAITECERVQTGIEVDDVDKALQNAVTAVAEANGRVTKSELKQLAAGQFNATLHCEVSPTAAGPFRDRLSQQGRVARLEIDRVQTSEGGQAARNAKVTRGDTQFLVQFYNLANVAPRETRTLLIAVPDVAAGYQSLREAIAKTRGRVLTSRLDEQDRQNVTAQLDFEVPRADEAALSAALASAGEMVARNAARATDGENLTDAKVLFRTALVSAGRLRPRETTTLAVEVPDVDAAIAVLKAQVGEASGRSVDAQAAHERGGRVTARLIYDMPLSAASALVEKVKAAGIVRVQQSAQDQQAPDGKLATARLDVTLSNTDLIVAKDDGLWPQVRRGLSLSAVVLLTSVTWVVFGLCVVLPWALVGYGGYRVFRWLVPKGAGATPAPATTT